MSQRIILFDNSICTIRKVLQYNLQMLFFPFSENASSMQCTFTPVRMTTVLDLWVHLHCFVPREQILLCTVQEVDVNAILL